MTGRTRTLAALTAALAFVAALLGLPDAARAAVFTPSNPSQSAVPGSLDATVTGAGGSITGVTVTLNNLSHPSPQDLDIELVAPSGRAVILMSDVCGTTNLSNVTLTFDDAGAAMPRSTACASGTYKPTDSNVAGDTADAWPVASPSTSLSRFRGDNPNGTWRLYLLDDTSGHSGALANGFQLTIETAGFTGLLPGEGTSGPASNYPIAIGVSNRVGLVAKAEVVIRLSHSSVGDLTGLLVAPDGKRVLLFAHPCGTGVAATNVTWTFSDSASAPLPASGTGSVATCGTGNYQAAGLTSASLPGPAPAPPYATSLSVFKGEQPNGKWQLYLNDDASGGSGFLAGVSLNLSLTDVTPPNTKIVKAPKTSHRHRVRISFVSSEARSHFQCKLDDQRHWKKCRPTVRLKHLAVGLHQFKVRAVDAAGNRDPHPVIRRWRVLAPGEVRPHHR